MAVETVYTESVALRIVVDHNSVARLTADNEQLRASVDMWREKHHARAAERDSLAERLVGVADENRRLRARVQAVRDLCDRADRDGKWLATERVRAAIGDPQ